MKIELSTTKKQELSSSDRAREFFIRNKSGNNIDLLLAELTERLDKRQKKSKKTYELFFKAQHALGLDTHIPVAESVAHEHQYFITEFIRRTEEEYQCHTGIEKALA